MNHCRLPCADEQRLRAHVKDSFGGVVVLLIFRVASVEGVRHARHGIQSRPLELVHTKSCHSLTSVRVSHIFH